MIIDAWAQHPTLRQMQDPIFEPLRRWTKTATPTVELTIAGGWLLRWWLLALPAVEEATLAQAEVLTGHPDRGCS